LKSANHSFVGRKGPFLLFSETDANGATGFILLDAAIGKIIYTDSMDGEMIKAVSLEGDLLRLRFTRGANGSCSLVKDTDSCWAKMAKEGTIPKALAGRSPPVQACVSAYQKYNTPPNDPSIVTYDVEMTLSTAGKINVISRGAVGCTPLP
jgi:hypothetical protein